VNTKGYGGRELKKYIIVYTNDPNHPKANLIIYGKVHPFVSIEPSSISLSGFAGDKLQQKVRIIPRKDHPFTIVSSGLRHGGDIRFNIRERETWRGTEYDIFIENMRNEKGSYSDTIILKTDSKIKPEIRIPVYGRILIRQTETNH